MARVDVPEGAGEERARLYALRPELGDPAEAFSRAVQEHSLIPLREQEAARIRIAHINRCEPCSAARMADMDAWDLDESFYTDVDDPSRRGRYTERERLAIEFAERFAGGIDSFDDAFWPRLKANFTDVEIVDLGLACAKWLGLGRLNAILEVQVVCPIRKTRMPETVSTQRVV